MSTWLAQHLFDTHSNMWLYQSRGLNFSVFCQTWQKQSHSMTRISSLGPSKWYQASGYITFYSMLKYPKLHITRRYKKRFITQIEVSKNAANFNQITSERNMRTVRSNYIIREKRSSAQEPKQVLIRGSCWSELHNPRDGLIRGSCCYKLIF